MIRVAGKFIYLCTPHTGSRSTANVLLTHCGGKKLTAENVHHATLEDLKALDRERYPEPFFSLLRNPYEFVLRSYWYHIRGGGHAPISLDQFIEGFKIVNRVKAFGPYIATYMDFVDRYFLFEEGLERFFVEVGFPEACQHIPTLGKNTLGPKRLTVGEITDEQKRMIEAKFSKDVALYKRVRDENADKWNRIS